MASTAATVQGAAGANVIVAPFYAQLDATGSASLDLLTEQNVSMAYDVSYGIALNDASSCAILNAFQTSGSGSSLAVGMRGNVEGSSASAFRNMIKFVIDNALNASGNTAQTDLYNDAIETFKSVYGDEIGNLLQSNWALDVSVHSTTGAANVWGDFDTDANSRLLLAQQIPDTDYMANSDASENSLTDALPLTGGDQLVFLFNLSSTLVSRTITDVKVVTTASTPGASVSNGPQEGGTNSVNMDANAAGTSSNAGADATAMNDATANARNGNTAPALATSNNSTSQLVAFYVTLNATAGVGEPFAAISSTRPAGQDLIADGQTGGLGDQGTVIHGIPVQSGVDPNANV